MQNLQPRNFVVYKSSAGSGKTHTLVREYLRLVIENPERYRHILAITFTNKAANEMKDRILEYLKEIGNLHAGSKGLIRDLVHFYEETLGLSTETIMERARTIMDYILHNYTNFAVSTIDSFTHRLVKSFARDLRLPVNFEVETDSEQLIKNSIDLLISKVGADPGLTKILVKFTTSKLEDEKSWNIEADLRDFAGILMREDSTRAVKKIRKLKAGDFILIANKLNGKMKSFEKQLSGMARQAKELIDAKNIQPNSFYRGNSGLYAYLKRFAEWDFSKPRPNSYVNDTIYEDKWTAKKCPADEKAAIEKIAPQLIDYFEKIQDLLEKDFPEYQLCKLIYQNIYPIAVLNEIEKVMEEFRENENIVHISEFNKRIAAIVAGEPVPFIYERVGEKYQHFLIDEFQDTSLLQWQNLLPLFENSLGSNQFNMIVGDGKQAIYRFRNGEVEQFSSLPEIYDRKDDDISQLRENLLKSQYHEVVLGKNYRSHEEIIHFNNEFFAFAGPRLSEDLGKIYTDVLQEPDPEKKGGLVHIDFIPKPNRKKEEFEEAVLKKILHLIQNDLKGYPAGNIAVLTRSNHEGSLVAQHLIENRIKVVSSEVLRLDSSPEVLFIVSMLQHLHDPGDIIPAAEILTFLYLSGKLNDSSLHESFLAYNQTTGTNNRENLRVLLEKQGFNTGAFNSQELTITETIGQIIDTFGLDSGGRNPFLQFLLDHALEFAGKNNEGIAEFLELWDEKIHKQSIVVPETGDAVKIMTIHKAKGLQFPVVIYPFAINRSKLSKEQLWIEPKLTDVPDLKTALVKTTKPLDDTDFASLKEKETARSFLDSLNLLYVTLTRPVERIYIFTEDKTNAKGEWTMSKPFSDHADLLHGYLIEKQRWQNRDEQVYVFGKPPESGKERKPETAGLPLPPDTPYAAEWRKKIRFRQMASRVWDVDNPDRNRQWGNLVHYLMSQIKTAGDVEMAVQTAANQGLINEKELKKMLEKIHRIIQNPAIAEYYQPGNRALTEQDILDPAKGNLRPDRIVITKNGCAVIDYKTGSFSTSHETQIRNYMEVLKNMGYQDLKGYLVYVDGERVERV